QTESRAVLDSRVRGYDEQSTRTQQPPSRAAPLPTSYGRQVTHTAPQSSQSILAGSFDVMSVVSKIYLHPQASDIDFIAAATCFAVTSRNGAGTGVDQIVRSDPRAVALLQPF